MSLILNIRGTNGSGKSTLVRQIMDHFGVAEALRDPAVDKGKVWAYKLGFKIPTPIPIYVLGRYESICGGVDTIKDFATTRERISRLAALGHTIFEGVLWSTVFKSSDLFVKENPFHKIVFAILDTSEEICIERVMKRRQEKGNTKPFNPAELISKITQIRLRMEDLKNAGFDTRIIPYQDGLKTVLNWMTEMGIFTEPLLKVRGWHIAWPNTPTDFIGGIK